MERTVRDRDRERRSRPGRRRDQAAERAPSAVGSGTVETGRDASSPVASLQRTAGNQAVQRLHEDGELGAELAVSHPTDRAEREAERVAEQVVRTPDRREGSVDRGNASVDGRNASGSVGSAPTVRPARIGESPGSSGAVAGEQAAGGGQAGERVERLLGSASSGHRLPAATRSFFEPRLGRDFGDVRVHSGPRADAAARSIDALGFTYGTDVAFRSGAYQPGTPRGRELIGHELVHVVQQDARPTPRPGVASRSAVPGRDGGVVQRTPDNGGQGGYTSAGPVSRPRASGQQSTPRPAEPGEGESPSFRFSSAPERDPTCSDLGEGAKGTLRQILSVVTAEVDGFRRWRNGETWDSPSGQRIPETDPLQTQFQRLTRTTFVCADDPTKGLPATDPLVREYLFSGVGDQEGLTETDVNYINEWLRYEGERSIPSIQSYFGLSPEPIQHDYGVQIELAGDVIGVGLGLGAKGEVFDIGVEAGCYVDVDSTARWLEFSYSNDLGMRWTVEYLGGDVSLGAECSIGASAGGVETSFGSEGLCTGAASSRLYYGPSDFAGSMTEWDAGVGVAAGGGVKAGGGDMTVKPSSDRPELEFDTSGVCGQVLLGGEVTVGEGAGSWGGQIDVSDAEVTTAPVRDVYDVVLGPLYELLPNGWRTLLTRHLFYDTGSSDTLRGAYADHNVFAIRDITEALDAAGQEFPPDEIEFVLSGHASPRWRAAEDPDEAVEENTALAGRRVEDARNTILSMYDQYQFMGGWPPASFAVERVSVVNVTEAGPFTTFNLGPSVGLAETGDPENNAQLYRRVTAELTVAHWKERRLNVLDLDVPEGRQVLYCPFLPQSRPSE